MLITDRCLTRRDQHVLSHDLPGAVRDRQQPPSSVRSLTSVPISRVGTE